jgi:hypothetical protein
MDISLRLLGVGAWSSAFTDWPALRAILRGDCAAVAAGPAKPAPAVLPAAERRRAPETVLLAAQAAAEACAMAQCEAADLACVFASSQGDVTITDAMCATLAAAPLELSPTKFHNSVHNAPAGYWTIAAQCHRASTALSAREYSVGAGLLETAIQALDQDAPTLLVCYDGAAGGTVLQQMAPHACGFAAAFVLAPAHGTAGRLLRLRRAPPGTLASAWPSTDLAGLSSNPSAAALVLLGALAAEFAVNVHLPASPGMMLSIDQLE